MRRVERGSVAVIALIMVASTTVVAITMISLATGVRTKQTRLETNQTFIAAMDGALEIVDDMSVTGVLTLPLTLNVTIGNVSVSTVLTGVSNSAFTLNGVGATTTAPTILATATLTHKGQTYKRQEVIGKGVDSSAWKYALHVDSAVSSSFAISTGASGLDGDAWIDGNVSLANALSHIRGNLTSTGLIFSPGLKVDGTKTTNATAKTFPIPNSSDYQSVAISVLPNNSTINGHVFPAPNASGYPVLYVNGDASIRGDFTGSGIIYVTGKADIVGSVTSGLGDYLLIICKNVINLWSGATTIDAYLFSGGNLNTNSGTSSHYVVKRIVAKCLVLNNDLSVSFDPLVRDNPAEAYKMKFPGIWP